MPLKTTTILLQVSGGEQKLLGANSTPATFPETNPLYTGTVTLANGTGAGNAQKIGIAAFSLTGGASVTFDLTAFAGPYGNVNFSSIKHCQIDNQSSDPTNVLEIGDDGTVTNPWTSPFSGTAARVKLGNSAAPLVLPAPASGFAVDGTHKNLKVKNIGSGTNALNGNVLLIGEGT